MTTFDFRWIFQYKDLDHNWKWRGKYNWWEGILWHFYGPNQVELLEKAKKKGGPYHVSLINLIKLYL